MSPLYFEFKIGFVAKCSIHGILLEVLISTSMFYTRVGDDIVLILFSSLIDSPLIIFKCSDGMIYFPNVDSLILLLMFVCIFLSVIMMMAGLIRP